MEKTTIFAPETTHCTTRYYLVRVTPLKENEMITEKDVVVALSGGMKRLFGDFGRDKMMPAIHEVGECMYVVSIPNKDSTYLRATHTIPVQSQKISRFDVVSESSFLQTLLHDSSLFFKPLQ